MSNLQPNCCLEFDFRKVDQHAGGKWLIHDTKRRKDNQLQSLKLPCRISKLSSKMWNKGVRWHRVESNIDTVITECGNHVYWHKCTISFSSFCLYRILICHRYHKLHFMLIFHDYVYELCCCILLDFMLNSPWLMTLIAWFMGPTWGPSGADRTQVGPMLGPWTLLSGESSPDNKDHPIDIY